jgi:transposase InsO family protein
LICRYEALEKLVTDYDQNFNGRMTVEFCAKYKVKHLNSSPYKPKMNGVIEAVNKNI